MPLTALEVTNLPRSGRRRPMLRIQAGPDLKRAARYVWLNDGVPGSLETAQEMAQLVRNDAVTDQGLQDFAAQIVINAGLDSHSPQVDIVRAVFRFVQRVAYIADPVGDGGFDAVHSARVTLARGYGDCDDLAVLLATLLAQVGLKSRFVLARYKQKTKGFDHVYVDVQLRDGRMALDPVSRLHEAGWESPRALERIFVSIFGPGPLRLSALAGNVTNLALTGAAVGLNFVPVVGPILASFVGPIASLFSRSQQRAEETQRDEWKNQVLATMRDIERAVDDCQITKAQGDQAAQELMQNFYRACDQFSKSSVAQSCRNFETQDVSGGAQEGAFRTHVARIKAAGASCAIAGGRAGGNVALATAGQINWTTLLLIAGGGYLLIKMLR